MIYLLIFLSGFAGLVYQVLWMKQLGLLFGNTSHAAAATLAAFFGGLALGSWLVGRRTGRMKNPLRMYAWLQIGIAGSAVLYFVVLHGYYAVYPLLYQSISAGAWMLAVKFFLALVLVLPPAICMGGTIPVIAQHVIRRPSGFGRTAALLYGINTLGAALGAFVAGFFLPLWLGFRITCLAAMALNVGVGLAAFLLARKNAPKPAQTTTSERPGNAGLEGAGELDSTPPPGRGICTRAAVSGVCFLSGFGFLALEVLWTRMFAQVLENSVYTFAAILVIVLVCLAAGALISSCLARLNLPPFPLLASLLLVSGLVVALTPAIFMHETNGLQILAMRSTWSRYVMMIFSKGFLTLGLPALLLGTVFPFLMKTEERYVHTPGRSLGRLGAVNTSGAILGSLICGFVLLETLGMWGTMRLLALIYLVAAILLPLGWGAAGITVRVVGCLLLAVILTKLDPTRLPVTSTDPLRHRNEQIVEVWEASDATVAVVRDNYGLAIKMNSHYGLGSTGALRPQQLQADIPLMVYPDTESIFFLGMGTGITAGSALDPQFEQVKKIVVCELVPEVIAAAKKYMTNVNGYDLTNGLFEDPRVTLLAEDGRHYMMATGNQFDMINGDLFVPFRSGVGSLYTREHFQNVKNRLSPDGVFFQWIPLYQVTENEFSIMARTMLSVFDQVSLWRTNFQPGQDVVALAGHKQAQPLPAADFDSAADKQQAVAGKTHRDLGRLALPFNARTILFFYCGNLTQASDLFEAFPVNTDDRPVIEYMAPRTYRGKTEASVPWFVGPRLARLVEAVQERCPPGQDPLLKNRTPANRRLPRAGSDYYRARIYQLTGDEEQCEAAWDRFLRAWLDGDDPNQVPVE